MSRWAETFARLSGGRDTVDTTRQSGSSSHIVSHSVESVTAPVTQPEPVPAAERAAAAWGEDERAAAVEHDSNVPRAWTERFARLDPDMASAGLAMTPRRWRAIYEAIEAFLERWGAEAARLGWQAEDIFGADATRPEVTWLNSGPLWSSDGACVVALFDDRIVFETVTGSRQTAPKRPHLRPRVLPWALGNLPPANNRARPT
jgi:hypothetical protein